MKFIVFALILLFSNFYSFSQVGIGTTTPNDSAILDIESTDKGLLIPRLTTTQRNNITTPAPGLMIFNTSTNTFEFNSGTPGTPAWSKLNPDSSVHIGKFIITGTGTQTVTGLPFEPSSIKFSAHANVETYNLNSDNGVGNNSNTFQNAFGTTTGYATNYNGSIEQQAIYVGGSGTSINDISRYASSSRAIGIRYSNQNGDSLGLTAAEVTSFNTNGFTINVTDHTEDIVVIFEAHR
ncbi:hypothetical protein [Algibacter pectinivorans]|uniref:Curlin associated repeat-containing protein n=1 Tax=Algibacter pectinivorans TaxID=870482 RepID=A0A1I1M7C8_9FLAO|nr:hypothetical protein [Algibacter pectinivorans]SFC81417.1 hypothetical protein SAMN04487987_10186 [Algibacter pectinivorans]